MLIGAGRFGRNHLRVWRELSCTDLCDLHAVVDKREKVVEQIRCLYPGLRVSTDYTEFLDEVDAVDVVTNASTHYEM